MKTSQAENILIALEYFKGVHGKVGVRIARNKRMIEEELVEYFNAKNELIRKYGEEKNGIFQVNPMSDNYKKFMEEIAPLLDEEVSFNFRTFTDEELEECDELTSEQSEFLMRWFV